MSFLRSVCAFFLAVIVMAVLGVVIQSVFVLIGLADVGASIRPGPALGMIGDDLRGLAPLYGVIIALGFLIAFLAAAFVGRVASLPRSWVFAGAGGVCMVVTLLAMQEVFFGVQVIAGARTTAGFLVQTAAGALAGALYARLTPERQRRAQP